MNKLKYADYMRSPYWRRRAKDRMAFDRHTCQVCGAKATEVHHLTYANFGHEPLDDLVSVCAQCHKKAEEIAGERRQWPKKTAFMAAVREDAARLAPEVFKYIAGVRGRGFTELLALRQPRESKGRQCWNVLIGAVRALCAKRYAYTCADDRKDMALTALTNRVRTVALAAIARDVRAAVQAELQDLVRAEADAESYGLTPRQVRRIGESGSREDRHELRKAVLFYGALDAAAGFNPEPGSAALTKGDYQMLNQLANYIKAVEKT